MADAWRNAAIVRDIAEARDEIALRLGADWPAFAGRLDALLAELVAAADVEQQRVVDRVLRLGLGSRAAGVFRAILNRYAPADLDRTRRGPAAGGAPFGVTTAGEPAPAEAAKREALDLKAALAGAAAPRARYLNAGFFPEADNTAIPPATPLSLGGGPYRLGVNVGRFWGPGTPGDPVPEGLFAAVDGPLVLDVIPRSLDATFTPVRKPLALPETGDSALVFFGVTFAAAGRVAVDVDLMYRNHLVQSRRTEVDVLPAGADLASEAGTHAAQDGYITFTRTAAFDPDDLGTEPRTLTVVAERSLGDRISLRFYEAAPGGGEAGAEVGVLDSELNDDSLARVMTFARERMKATMTAYAGRERGDAPTLRRQLAELAEAGREFYLALLPGLKGGPDGASPRVRAELSTGTVIQVAPLSTQLGVPWELLYERPIEAAGDAIRLCRPFADFAASPPGAGAPPAECPGNCPDRCDAQAACPLAFWGYRYRVEQIPCRVDPGATLPAGSLLLVVPNGRPLRMASTVSTQLSRWKVHLDRLEALAPGGLTQVRLLSRAAVKAELTAAGPGASVLYFYTHGDPSDWRSSLGVGATEKIRRVDLDAWRPSFRGRSPLVVLNACDTANYTPDRFENLIQFFHERRAAGVVGTQCEVRELLADRFIGEFFRRFLAGETAGAALHAARLALLHDALDPRGLCYSLFASADVRLARPVVP
jgi:hypothetical protein